MKSLRTSIRWALTSSRSANSCLDIADRLADDDLRHLLVEGLKGAAVVLLRLRHLLEDGLELALERPIFASKASFTSLARVS